MSPTFPTSLSRRPLSQRPDPRALKTLPQVRRRPEQLQGHQGRKIGGTLAGSDRRRDPLIVPGRPLSTPLSSSGRMRTGRVQGAGHPRVPKGCAPCAPIRGPLARTPAGASLPGAAVSAEGQAAPAPRFYLSRRGPPIDGARRRTAHCGTGGRGAGATARAAAGPAQRHAGRLRTAPRTGGTGGTGGTWTRSRRKTGGEEGPSHRSPGEDRAWRGGCG